MARRRESTVSVYFGKGSPENHDQARNETSSDGSHSKQFLPMLLRHVANYSTSQGVCQQHLRQNQAVYVDHHNVYMCLSINTFRTNLNLALFILCGWLWAAFGMRFWSNIVPQTVCIVLTTITIETPTPRLLVHNYPSL